MRKVFLDTSFILGFVNSNDDLHENAKKWKMPKIYCHKTVT